MAKSKSVKVASSKTQNSEKKESADKIPEKEQEPQALPPNVINIKATSYQNIKTIYPLSDLTMKFQFEGEQIFESPKVNVVTHDRIDTDFQISLPCDLTNTKDIDKYISSPIVVTIIETERVGDVTEVHVLAPEKKASIHTQASSASSTPSKGKKSTKSETATKKSKKEKGGKDKKSKLSEKMSKSSSGKAPSSVNFPIKPVGPIILGQAKLDLLPLFLGKIEYAQSLHIEQVPPIFDENAVAIDNLLKVNLLVNLEGPPVKPDNTTVLHISIESLYNIPSIVSGDYQYELCLLLPGKTLKLEPIIFNKGRTVAENRKFKYKFWPRSTEIQTPIPSTYRIPDNTSNVKNQVDIDLDKVINNESTRVEWNILKRRFLTPEFLSNFHYHIRKYRKIPIEIYITPIQDDADTSSTKKKPAKAKSKDKQAKGKSSTSLKTSRTELSTREVDTSVDYLHVMGLIDVGYLLYPGITKCRIACPLNTYQEVEIFKAAGLEDSYFRPKPPAPPVEAIQLTPKKGKGGKGKGKESKASSKSSKSSKGKKGKKEKGAPPEGTNLAEFLPPPPPPPPEPSKQVLNDKGEPAFLILELELVSPLSPKKELDELDSQLEHIIPKKPELPKRFISSRIAEEMYYETIRCLINDMNVQYKFYEEERRICTCDIVEPFLIYLQQMGIYQTYLTTIIRCLTTLVPEKYDINNSTLKSGHEYQLFVADIFVDLCQQMNQVINENLICNVSSKDHKHNINNDKMLLYAKEAMELGEQTSAERYFLERVCCREDNADVWFDYAVFLMEIGSREKAMECLTEALSIDNSHKHALFLYGLLLSDKGLKLEAETCLLRMVFIHPRWVEGWGSLHSFYKHHGNFEGAEFSLDMAHKYCSDSHTPTDYFSNSDDLAWSSEKCKDGVFLRTAVLMIKMRLYEHAERVLCCTFFKHKGECRYLLGVMAYLQKEYDHSLDHLKKAEHNKGLDYGICSTMGHCYIKLNNHKEALHYYDVVLSMFDRPEDAHLVFLNAAIAYDIEGESQKARQLCLLACKLSPTPQSWLFAGGFFYKQTDLLSAQECLIQSNLCDNRLPDPWAYLALINAQMDRMHQCQLCMTQAKKFNVENKKLIKNIELMVKSYMHPTH